MTALNYRKLSVVMGYTQAIGCSILLGILIMKAMTGVLNPILTVFSVLFLLFMIGKSYVEVTRQGTILRVFTKETYRIQPIGKSAFECFLLVCFLCIISPFIVMLGDFTISLICILFFIASLTIGIAEAMPSQMSKKIIQIVESDFSSLLEEDPLGKKIPNIQIQTEKSLFETFSLN